ncbi:MAG: hypothetical protein MRQ09_06665 [Candidatus Midichloria sp.]|nr:hypothetical protein [Candidatus Midichloria sp.]
MIIWAPPTAWSSNQENQCTAQYTEEQWNYMSNTDVWNLARKPSIGTCGWHVKNPYYTNTGIFVADGDEFKISWSGDYSYIESNVLFENSAGQFLSDSNILKQNNITCMYCNPNNTSEATEKCRTVLKIPQVSFCKTKKARNFN